MLNPVGKSGHYRKGCQRFLFRPNLDLFEVNCVQFQSSAASMHIEQKRKPFLQPALMAVINCIDIHVL